MYIQAYGVDGSFKKTINNPTNDATWNEQINLWQGMAVISTSSEFNDDTIQIGDFIQYLDDTRIVYSWFVSDIDRFVEPVRTTIRYYVRGLGTILNDIVVPLINYGTVDPVVLLDTFIAELNSKYNNVLTSDFISAGSTGFFFFQRWWIDFINIVLGEYTSRGVFVDYFIYPDWRWKWSDSRTTVHNLTIWREIESLDIQERGSDIINRLEVERWFPNNPSETIYQNPASIAQYWYRAKFDTSQATRIQTQGRADTYWNNIIATKSVPTLAITMTVNNKADLFAFHPGDFVNVMGLDYPLPNVRVERLQYSGEKVKLYFEVLESFISLIKS
jgi:hypothetical protein